MCAFRAIYELARNVNVLEHPQLEAVLEVVVYLRDHFCDISGQWELQIQTPGLIRVKISACVFLLNEIAAEALRCPIQKFGLKSVVLSVNSV